MDPRLKTLDDLFEALNGRDPDGVIACFSPDAVFLTAAGPTAEGRRIEGHDAIRAAFEAIWTAMPDVRWTMRGRRVIADDGLAEWLFTGTNAQGDRVEVEGVDLFTFAGDRIATKNAFRKERTAA